MAQAKAPIPITVAFNQFAWDAVDVLDDFVDDLERLGYEPRVQSPRNGQYSGGGIVVDETVAVTLFVGGIVGGIARQVLEEKVHAFFSKRLDRSLGTGREDEDVEIAVIYGPGGEVLSEVELGSDPPPRRKRARKRKRAR